MLHLERFLEIISPILGIVIVMLFGLLFPEVVRDKGNFLFLIGVTLSIYGISLAVISTYYTRNLREVPNTLAAVSSKLREIDELRSSGVILPLETCLEWEREVSESVYVLTHDFSHNVDEVGTPKLMFNTVVYNLKRGIRYKYCIVDASTDTIQNLELLQQRLRKELSGTPHYMDNFQVEFVEKGVALLFSFALFDVNLVDRKRYGFVFVHTFEEPVAIPMTLQTYKQARSIFAKAVSR